MRFEGHQSVCCRTPPGPYNSEIIKVIELEDLLYMAEVTALGALARKESRGSHYRTDYTERNDAEWLKHTVAKLEGEDIALSYKDVEITKYEPKERTY